MVDFLPYGHHEIDESDIQAVVNVLKNENLTQGEQVPQLEAALSEYLGGPEVVVCSSGTTALHLSCMAAGMSEEGCAIVPAITFLSTANAVRMTGADVVFADVDPANGLMTEQSVLEAASRAQKKIQAVIPVQLTGQSPDMNSLQRVAHSLEAKMITDSCHSLGGVQKDTGFKLGSGVHEDFACFSFHPVKAIAMGEGGAVATRDKGMAQKMRLLRSHHMEVSKSRSLPWVYHMHELGYNYRATEIQAALGLSQMKRLDSFLTKRRVLADQYNALLADFHPIIQPVKQTQYALSAWHIYSVLIDFKKISLSRGDFIARLKSLGVGSQVHYIPVCNQPYYRSLYGEQNFPGAQSYYEKTLTLPLFPSMTLSDLDRVVDAIRSILK